MGDQVSKKKQYLNIGLNDFWIITDRLNEKNLKKIKEKSKFLQAIPPEIQ